MIMSFSQKTGFTQCDMIIWFLYKLHDEVWQVYQHVLYPLSVTQTSQVFHYLFHFPFCFLFKFYISDKHFLIFMCKTLSVATESLCFRENQLFSLALFQPLCLWAWTWKCLGVQSRQNKHLKMIKLDWERVHFLRNQTSPCRPQC